MCMLKMCRIFVADGAVVNVKVESFRAGEYFSNILIRAFCNGIFQPHKDP